MHQSRASAKCGLHPAGLNGTRPASVRWYRPHPNADANGHGKTAPIPESAFSDSLELNPVATAPGSDVVVSDSHRTARVFEHCCELLPLCLSITSIARRVKMKFSMRQTAICAVSVSLVVGFSANLAFGAEEARTQDATRHASAAAKVFTEIMNVRDKAIPKELLDKAEAIAVFPDVIKAAFIFGGKGGQGVISRRTRNGWTAPRSSTSAVEVLARRSARRKLITCF